jgi:ribosomal protein L37AE/L43A
VLALVWLMTRRRARICPHCGEDVKKGRTTCQKCGYDFTIGGKPPEAAEA